LGRSARFWRSAARIAAATFWKLGAQATSVARSSILLHYDLFPYLYSLARASSRYGSPILQPLGLVYPRDEQAWNSTLELLVGRDLLAAPVTSVTRTASVYVPGGRWIDLFTGHMVDGGRKVRRATPLRQFPLYLRAGATIPFNLRSAHLWRRNWPLDALQLRGRAGWLSGASKVELTGAPPESEVLFPRDSLHGFGEGRRPGAAALHLGRRTACSVDRVAVEHRAVSGRAREGDATRRARARHHLVAVRGHRIRSCRSRRCRATRTTCSGNPCRVRRR